jgi:hypothetical protein
MIKANDLVNSNQEMQAGLTELTGQELSEMNGGYAADIAFSTGNPALAAFASGTVAGRVATRALAIEQVNIGVPADVVRRGFDRAASQGAGFFTLPVTAAKLG